MKNILFIFCFSLFLLACNSDSETSEGTQDSPPITNTENPDKYPAPSFELENYKDSLDNPKTSISLYVGNKKLKVADAVGCEKIKPADYEQYQIPKEAIDACGGWWAGAGDYFYIIDNGNDNYTVMQGEMQEENEANNYDYKMVMNLSNKLIPKSEK